MLILTIIPIERFGLAYYGVFTEIAGQSACLATFMSQAGARTYCTKLLSAAGVPQKNKI